MCCKAMTVHHGPRMVRQHACSAFNKDMLLQGHPQAQKRDDELSQARFEFRW